MTVGSTLALATGNAASGRDGRPGAPSTPDLTDWAADAATLAVDVVAAQEVDHLLPRSGGVDQTALLREALSGGGDAWHSRFAAAVHGTPGDITTMRSAPATRLAEPSYGVALLSRHPVTEWHELRMAPSAVKVPVPRPSWTDEPLVVVPDEQRVALAARVEAPGGAVTVVTTHLSFVPWRAAGQLRELVAWARGLPRPLVLAGDLNLPAPVVERLVRGAGLRRVPTGPTYPARRPVGRLDHVLVDGLVPVGEASLHRLAASDHLAVVVALRRG
ncbi:endonuclease/exonuclease/phosphatase family protein [Nocardioides solisilvae]|uniref:endonuclease/exonuclease/phosphatase family protein n=1 Tax=Nocardioides solisilvae TaxID=1542435 RepID=UPI0013A52E93|nr:endonuclease/exonuclease/phosphatase family protein [Nocardioides solisilvae]